MMIFCEATKQGRDITTIGISFQPRFSENRIFVPAAGIVLNKLVLDNLEKKLCLTKSYTRFTHTRVTVCHSTST